MERNDVAKLEAAVAALNESDIDAFVALLASDMKWEGIRPGLRWWRHRPN